MILLESTVVWKRVEDQAAVVNSGKQMLFLTWCFENLYRDHEG